MGAQTNSGEGTGTVFRAILFFHFFLFFIVFRELPSHAQPIRAASSAARKRHGSSTACELSSEFSTHVSIASMCIETADVGDGDFRLFPDYACIEAARSWFRKLVQMRNSRQGECSARPAVNWRMRNKQGQERWFFGSWHAVWRVMCDPP